MGDQTHVSTRVMGTYGYAAPEYVMTGELFKVVHAELFVTYLFSKNSETLRFLSDQKSAFALSKFMLLTILS